LKYGSEVLGNLGLGVEDLLARLVRKLLDLITDKVVVPVQKAKKVKTKKLRSEKDLSRACLRVSRALRMRSGSPELLALRSSSMAFLTAAPAPSA